jgi:hypothetical protein
VLRGLERAVDDLEDGVVLPVAEAEDHDEGEQAPDEPAAQLVQVLDEAQTVLVPDRADTGHDPRGAAR